MGAGGTGAAPASSSMPPSTPRTAATGASTTFVTTASGSAPPPSPPPPACATSSSTNWATPGNGTPATSTGCPPIWLPGAIAASGAWRPGPTASPSSGAPTPAPVTTGPVPRPPPRWSLGAWPATGDDLHWQLAGSPRFQSPATERWALALKTGAGSDAILDHMPVRCLIVDDNSGFLRSARLLLEREGLSVVAFASTGDDAMQQVDALAPDVVLVDIDLGGESGFDL